MLTTDFETIPKEQISDLKFPDTDVLKDEKQKKSRKTNLKRVLNQTDANNPNVKIYFEDESSLKVVESTVWAVTDKRVILQQSVDIPISRIHSVKL